MMCIVACLNAGPAMAEEGVPAAGSASGRVFLLNTNFNILNQSTPASLEGSSTPIKLDTAATGQFDADSPVHSDNTHYKLYSFEALAGQKIAISMSSNDFTPYLELWNSPDPIKTQILVSNKGVKGGTASKIPGTGDYYEIMNSGTYYIFTDAYTAGETGSYTLELKGAPLSGVTLTFARADGGTAPAPVTTGPEGTWSQIGFEEGAAYTVTPSYMGYAFPVASRQFTAAAGNTDIDFSGMIPGLKAAAPSGGNATAGNAVTIVWSYVGNPGSQVKLEVLKGTDVIDSIKDQPLGTGNSGSYTWTIPPAQAAGTDYAFRVTSASDVAISAVSPKFTINASGISLTAPSGAKSWAIGQTYTIAWNYAGNAAANVKIELMDGANAALLIADNVNIAQGTYNWMIPEGIDTGRTYTIRLTRSDTGGTAASANLSVIPATYTASGYVTEICRAGDVNEIEKGYRIMTPSIFEGTDSGSIGFNQTCYGVFKEYWVMYNVNHLYLGEYFNVYLFRAFAGQKVAFTLRPDLQGEGCKTLRFALSTDPLNYDYIGGAMCVERTGANAVTRIPSTGYYTIPYTGLYFVYVGTDYWDSSSVFKLGENQRYSITCETAPLSGVEVNFARTGGESAAGGDAPGQVITGEDGKWTQTFPNGNTYNAELSRGGYTINPAAYTLSGNTTGLVSEGNPPRSIKVNSPGEGVEWVQGDTRKIEWTYNNDISGQVKVSLWRNGNFVASLPDASIGSLGNGSCDWTPGVDMPTGGGYQIQVETPDGQYVGKSGSFAIHIMKTRGRVRPDRVEFTGNKVPDTGGKPVTALKFGLQDFDTYTMGDTQYSFQIDGITYETDKAYYFNAKSGSRLDLLGLVDPYHSEISYICIAQIQENGSLSVIARSNLTRNGSTYFPGIGWYSFTEFSFTVPSDGLYLVMLVSQNLNPGPDNPYHLRTDLTYNIRAEMGIPGVTMQVIPQGNETGYNVTTDANGDWEIETQFGNSYRIVPSGNNLEYTPAYLDIQKPGIYDITAALTQFTDVGIQDAETGWRLRNSKAITWKYYGNPGTNVKLELLKGGAVNRIIVESVGVGADGTGSYNWTVPADLPLENDYSIRVTSVENSQYTATGSQFAIINPLAVTAPAEGNTWNAGTVQSVTWNYGNADLSYTSGKVVLELLKGGTLQRTIVSPENGAVLGSNGTGSYSWTVPADLPVGSDYSIRVSTTDGRYPAESSLFTIANPLSVTSPATGNTWNAGSAKNVTWSYGSADLGSTVKLELIKAGESAGSVIAAGIPTGANGTGSYQWTLPADLAAGDYQVRVTSEAYPLVYATSQSFAVSGTFTLSGQILKNYAGPVSPLSAVGLSYGQVIVPVAAGQTINDSIDKSDYFSYGNTSGENYCDAYQIVLNAGETIGVNVQCNGKFSIRVQCPYPYNGGWIGTYYSDSIEHTDNGTYYFTANYTGSHHIYIFAKPPVGPYTLKIISPLSGAEVSFTDKAGTVPAPESKATDTNGRWSQTFNPGPTYHMSIAKEGYTITPDDLDFDANSGDINSTAVVNQLPVINSLTLDKREGQVGQGQTVTAEVYASAPEGTPVSVTLMELSGYSAGCPNFYSLRIAGDGTIAADGSAVLSLNIPGTLTAGYYSARAQLAGSAATVSVPYYIAGNTANPAITGIALSADRQYSGQSGTVGITVQTANVPDNTTVSALLADSSGNPLAPVISSSTLNITGNKALLSIGISPLLAPGEYQIRVTVNTANMLVAYKTYTIEEAGSSKNITGFTVPGQDGASIIKSADRTVEFHMPEGTNVSALVPTISIDGYIISPASGTARDFSSPIKYVVTATDGTKAEWTVSCIAGWVPSGEKSIMSFSIDGQIGSTVIDAANRTVTLEVPEGTGLTNLTPAFSLSAKAAASVGGTLQTSGVTANNFRSPVAYTITAEDGSTAIWTIYVNSTTRRFSIIGNALDRSSGINASVTISPTEGPDHEGTEVVVFQLLKNGSQPVGIVFTQRNINSAEKFEASFEESGAEYTVKVFVFDQANWDAGNAPANQAEPLLLQ